MSNFQTMTSNGKTHLQIVEDYYKYMDKIKNEHFDKGFKKGKEAILKALEE